MSAVALIPLALSCASDTARDADEGGDAVLLRRAQPLMGTRFEIQLYARDRRAASEAIEAAFREVARVEEKISEWRETSDISALNAHAAAGPIEVGDDLIEVVMAGQQLAEMTGGAFDLSFASCGRLWNSQDAVVPTPSEIARCLQRVGWWRIEVDRLESTIALADAGTRIGVGAIGKGYGVDRAAAVLERMGFESYVVDGGGDLRVRGRRGDAPWRVGVADPRQPQRLLGTLSVEDGAVVTSGDYERYFESQGRRYHHIIDPRTGYPADKAVSVTVVAPDAMWADGLATALFVLGPAEGLALARRLPEVEAMIVDRQLERHMTPGFARRLR